MSVVFALGDQHHPNQNKDLISFCKEIKRIYKPDIIVNIGDEAEFSTMSTKYIANPDGPSPGYEYESLLEEIQALYELFPISKVCRSNHTERPLKKAFHHGIPRAFIREVKEFLKAPDGWFWADQWVIDGVLYIHGEGIGSGVSAYQIAQAVKHRSVVHGHLHSFGGVVNFNDGERDRFVANTGCLIDPKASVFDYGKHNKYKPTLGSVIIIDGKKAIWEPM